MVAGKLLACKWVKLACERHLSNLEDSSDREYPYQFSKDAVHHVCEFIQGLPHTEGEWAERGELIKLEPWQKLILGSIFGWLKKEDGRRRYKVAYVEVPRKNAKSALAAAIGVYLTCADGEFGAQVYSAATTEAQAWEVFRPAKRIVERTPELAEEFGIAAHAKHLAVFGNGSFFKPVIGSPKDGKGPHGVIMDEYHEQDDDALLASLRHGMGARRNALTLLITTAGANMAGPCYSMRTDICSILEGTVKREDTFGLIYTIDETDDWASHDALVKANPNFNVSVFGEFLKSEQLKAIQSARFQNDFKTKHLDVWVGASAAFFNMERWKALGDSSLTPEQFKGLPCYAGVDLATRLDLAVRVKIFVKTIDKQKHFYVFADSYMHEEQVEDPKNNHYATWAKGGWLTVTPGSAISLNQFTDDTKAEILKWKIRQIAYDERYAAQFAETIAERHKEMMVEVPNNFQYLNEPMLETEALIQEGRIHHNNNPILTWCMSNVIGRKDRNERVMPGKERAENKIDAAVSMIMAVSRAIFAPDTTSVYATRGLLQI